MRSLLLTSASVLGTAAQVTAIPLAVAIVVLSYTGIETAGRPLPEAHGSEPVRPTPELERV